MIIDPGDEAQKIINEISNRRLKPAAIINTHGHIDHIGAVKKVKDEYNIPFYINEKEEELIEHADSFTNILGLPPIDKPNIDLNINNGDTLKFGQLEIEIIETPGHTKGGSCLKIRDHIFCGDTIFENSIGRTDLPGGNYSQLISSIKGNLLTFQDEINLHPGHGDSTTIGKERVNNPFLK